MRRLRHLINPSLGNQATVEITARTAGGHFLLKPDEEVNAILAGVLARAKANTGTNIYAHAFLRVRVGTLPPTRFSPRGLQGPLFQTRRATFVPHRAFHRCFREVWRAKPAEVESTHGVQFETEEMDRAIPPPKGLPSWSSPSIPSVDLTQVRPRMLLAQPSRTDIHT